MMPDVIDYDLKPPANSANLLICEPEPLRAPLPKAESYPVESLGGVLGSAATTLHETIKAPLTLCCQSVLASASLAAQTHFNVMLPWGESKPLSLFLLTVAESGERKSGVDDVVLGAAKAQERQDMEAYTIELKLYEAELAKWKEVADAANKAAAKASKSQAASDYAAEAKHSCPAKPEPPIMPLRFVTEPTVEGLYKLMAVSQPSIGLFSDEGGLLIGGNALNSDNALKTMARWCKLWDGAAFDRVRAGDGSGVLYGRRLAMHQLAQPDVMAQLLGDRMANGQGLLARCLVAWPESTIGSRHIELFEQPKERKEVKRLFAKLKTLTEAAPRTGKNEQELDPVELPLNEEAQQMAIAAMNQFETLMQSGNDLSELRDRASKALENACRIAGVLTAIEEGMAARMINSARLGRALVIIQWYLKETLRIKGAAVIPLSVSDAESLSRWLDASGYQVFRTRQVLHKGPSHLRNKKRLDAAIGELVTNGYLAENEPGMVIDGVVTKKSWSVHHVV
jgi:putative DNA primase/helicase